MAEVVDLSHPFGHGTITYPGLPGPAISDHLSRPASRERYAPGVEFQIGRIDMVANTGTYLDTPFHRYPDGHDLSGLDLSRVVDVPGVVVEGTDLSDEDVAGRAVLFATGWDRHWGTDAYGDPAHPCLSHGAADRLIEAGVALVGIDSVNIDSTVGGERPIHSALLAAGVPIVEHLTNLGTLVGRSFRFTAAPPAVVGMGTFPVRAVAVVH
jgi:arylformamidase